MTSLSALSKREFLSFCGWLLFRFNTFWLLIFYSLSNFCRFMFNFHDTKSELSNWEKENLVDHGSKQNLIKSSKMTWSLMDFCRAVIIMIKVTYCAINCTTTLSKGVLLQRKMIDRIFGIPIRSSHWAGFPSFSLCASQSTNDLSSLLSKSIK